MIHWAPERGIDEVFGELQGQIMTFKSGSGGGDPKNQRASDWSLQTGGVKDG